MDRKMAAGRLPWPRSILQRSVSALSIQCDSPSGTATQLQADFTVKCVNNAGTGKWVVEFPPQTNGQYRVDVKGVSDIAGNLALPFSINADVRCARSTASASMTTKMTSALGNVEHAPSSVANVQKVTTSTTIRIGVALTRHRALRPS